MLFHQLPHTDLKPMRKRLRYVVSTETDYHTTPIEPRKEKLPILKTLLKHEF